MDQHETVLSVDKLPFDRFISRASLLSPDDIVSSGWLEHAPFAFWLMQRLAPRCYVELGTHNGFSYFAFCQAVKKFDLDTGCYAIDTWAGDEHAGFYDGGVYNDVATINQKYAPFSTLIRSTFGDALAYFADGSVDLLHIDGRHFYDDAKEDFESWKPKLSENAVVLFHDTNVRERGFGVWKLFAELEKDHATFEFKHGNGLGVVAIGTPPPQLRDLFGAGQGEAEDIRYIYSQLGGAITSRGDVERERNALRRVLDQERGALEARVEARIEDEVEKQRGELQTRVDQAEYHLARLNAYGWTRIGFKVDRLLGGIANALSSLRSTKKKDYNSRP